MRILLTGGAGYIGSIATRRFLDRGFEVTVLDTLERGHRAAVDRRARLIVGDVGDEASVRRALADCAAVVHFAAYAEVAESQEHPEMYLDNNVARPSRMLDEMVRAGVRTIVFSSTAAVYGEPLQVPIAEDAPRQPVNAYGASKLGFERILEERAAAGDLWPLCLRYFNVVGAWPDGSLGEDHAPESHIVPRILRAALTGTPRFTLFGDDYPTRDGTCVRDYVHVVDLAEAHVRGLQYLLAGGAPAAINLGSAAGATNREVLRACEEVTGVTMEVGVGPRRPGDPAALVASGALAAKLLGWTPERNLQTAVADAWEWHRRHPRGYGDRRPHAWTGSKTTAGPRARCPRSA